MATLTCEQLAKVEWPLKTTVEDRPPHAGTDSAVTVKNCT